MYRISHPLHYISLSPPLRPEDLYSLVTVLFPFAGRDSGNSAEQRSLILYNTERYTFLPRDKRSVIDIRREIWTVNMCEWNARASLKNKNFKAPSRANQYFGAPITALEISLCVSRRARARIHDKIICNCNCDLKFIIWLRDTLSPQ